ATYARAAAKPAHYVARISGPDSSAPSCCRVAISGSIQPENSTATVPQGVQTNAMPCDGSRDGSRDSDFSGNHSLNPFTPDESYNESRDLDLIGNHPFATLTVAPTVPGMPG